MTIVNAQPLVQCDSCADTVAMLEPDVTQHGVNPRMPGGWRTITIWAPPLNLDAPPVGYRAVHVCPVCDPSLGELEGYSRV